MREPPLLEQMSVAYAEEIERLRMENEKLRFTDQELSIMLSAVGALLATMSLDVPPGQPTPPEMKMVEALQAKLMALNEGEK